jgi:iron complex transport system substrate-binding protein
MTSPRYPPSIPPGATSLAPSPDFPRRVVCLTDETTETLYLLGAEDRIVGVSGFTTRPPQARTKPRVSAFRDANLDAILELKPDLVFAFSDVQAEITRDLILRGVTVLNFNQRTIAGIFDMIALLARLIGKPDEGTALVENLRQGLRQIGSFAQQFPYRPRVFFEEWKDPLVSGIGWVEELITIAGGDPIFPELLQCGKARDRVIEPAAVLARDPEVILASWCGMKVEIDAIRARPGWCSINAVRSDHVYEIPSSTILQPGPAALTDGIQQIHAILARVVGANIPAGLGPKPVGHA